MIHTLVEWLQRLGRATVEMMLERHRLVRVGQSDCWRFVPARHR